MSNVQCQMSANKMSLIYISQVISPKYCSVPGSRYGLQESSAAVTKCKMVNDKLHITLYVKCQSVKRQMSNFKCQWSMVKCQVSNVKCQMSNVKWKVYALKVHYLKVYFLKVYFPKVYFLKVYFPNVFFSESVFSKSVSILSVFLSSKLCEFIRIGLPLSANKSVIYFLSRAARVRSWTYQKSYAWW